MVTDVPGRIEAALPWQPLPVPPDVPHGDMPGDKVRIGPSHVAKANAIFPALAEELLPVLRENQSSRAVIAVAGGSGVGKSEIASVLSYLLRSTGVGSYTLSGDNYVRRIPEQNDAERLRLFREQGLGGLIASGGYSPDRAEALRELQRADLDADPARATESWLRTYQHAGRRGLKGYLGTPAEADFELLSNVVAQFKNGAGSIFLRRMGRAPADLWYESVDLADTSVLVIEWTHGNNDFLRGVDVPVFLDSTPAETLEHRRARNRDGAIDSPFTTTVLGIEQELLAAQAGKAKVVLSMAGELLSRSDLRRPSAERWGDVDA